MNKWEHAWGLWSPHKKPIKVPLVQIPSWQRRSQSFEPDSEAPTSRPSPTGWSCSITGTYFSLCMATPRQHCPQKMEIQNKMPASDEHVCGDNKEKTQRGPRKRLCEPEEPVNGPMNCKLDFEVSVTLRRWVALWVSISPWLWGNLTAVCKITLGCRLVLYVFPCP